MENFENIYKLNVFNLINGDDETTIIMSDIPNYLVFNEILKEYNIVLEKNDEDFSIDELGNYIQYKGYFFYKPEANIDINI